MKKILYFDCFSGISGDMAVAALLDLGGDIDYLKRELSSLKLDGYLVEALRDERRGITGTRFVVHDSSAHAHAHHAHDGKTEHHGRNIKDIFRIIDESLFQDEVKILSKKIFTIVGDAEATVHGKPVDEIHFHEVGAVDSIVDIVSFAILFVSLRPDVVCSSPVNLGSGFVKCEHGTFPVPAPAVVEILKGVPVYAAHADKELTTPTGAAIIAAVAGSFAPLNCEIVKTGYGLGARDNALPNALRIIEGKETDAPHIVMIETNIDDMNPENYSYLFEKLFETGALDVYLSPVMMKKNRPGTVLTVMCRPSGEKALTEFIFHNTTTFGVRRYDVDRVELERRIISVDIGYASVPCKGGYYNGTLIKLSPEYEACRKLAADKNISFTKVYNDACECANKIIRKEV